MKKTSLLFALIMLSAPLLFSQETIDENGDTITYPFKKIMVIPFEENMFISGIQSDLIQKSGKSHKEIVKFFRYGIASAIQYEFLNSCKTTSLIHYNDTTHDLDRTYYSIFYKFEPYEEKISDAESSKKSKTKDTKSDKKLEKESITKIRDGQIVSDKKINPKFASLQIKDSSVFEFLHQKYKADLFVFVTQLDIENDLSDQLALATDTYLRFIRAHYAILDVHGKFISKGVESITFPNTENEMERIQAIYFKELAKKLQKNLPKIIKPKVRETTKDEHSKIKVK